MNINIDIDDSHEEAQAFVAYMRALKFIKINAPEDIFELSDEQKRILDQRRERHLNGQSKSYSWDQVKARARAAE